MKNNNNEQKSQRIIHSSQSYDKKYKKKIENENQGKNKFKNKNENKRQNLYRDVFLFSEEKEDSSEDDDNPEISIIVYYDGRKINTKFNRHKPFTEFVKFLSKRYFRVSFEDNYKIFYDNVEIPMNDKRKIKKIVNENETEIKFILKSKEKDFINSNLKKIYIELENIPSFMDLSDQINNFINSQKKVEINFDIIYKDNSCRILFSSSEIAFSFISYMTNIKFTNKFYRKLKIDIKYNALESNIYGINKHKNFRSMSEENIIKGNKEEKLQNNLALSNKKIKIKNKSRLKLRNNNFKNIKNYTESNNENKYIYNDYYEDNFESVQDSSPYGYESQLVKMQKILDRKKWMANKNFFTSINKHSFNRMITPNKYYFKKNINRNNIYKNNMIEKKFGINQYNDKIYKLKISEI